MWKQDVIQRRLLQAIIILFVIMLLAGEYTVFQPRPAPLQEPQLKLGTVVVNVPVVVYDKKTGAVYQNLKPANFELFEDKVKQEITHFAPISGTINLVMVLENNRSLRQINRGDYQPLADDVLAAASIFVTRFVVKGDYVAMVSFDMQPKVVTDFTDGVGQLRQGVAEVARDIVAFSESNLYDALLFVLIGGQDREGTEYTGLAQVEGRTAVLLIATGFNTFSRTTFDKMLKVVERAGVPIYTIGIGNLLYKRLDPYLSPSASLSWLQAFNTLRSIAESSGGQYFPVTFESELPATLEGVSALLHNQYSLGYAPSNPRAQGKRRKIELLVDVDGDGKPDNDRLVVQYRRSYREPDKNEEWLPAVNASRRSRAGAMTFGCGDGLMGDGIINDDYD
jgi:VWFA-related protein